ncbi:MAG: hypothetical protein WDA09_05150 [Bacteriovoracaceae bacterium]
MLRDKIDKFGYEYLGRKYLYLNVFADVVNFVRELFMDYTKEQLKEHLKDQVELLWPPKDNDNSGYSDQPQ